MKLFLTLFGLLLVQWNLLGQVSTDTTMKSGYEISSDSTIIKVNKEQKPKLIGGVYTLTQNINYPPKALENNIQGRVLLTCKVTSNGKVEDIKIVRSLGYGCDEEAIRLVREANWEPGKINDKNTDMEVLIPIKFEIKK